MSTISNNDLEAQLEHNIVYSQTQMFTESESNIVLGVMHNDDIQEIQREREIDDSNMIFIE